MKRTKIALLSLAILLVSVTSSFATILPDGSVSWTGSSGVLTNGMSFSPSDLQGLVVKGGDYTITITGTSTGKWGFSSKWSQGVSAFGNTIEFQLEPVFNTGAAAKPFIITSDPTTLTAGVYNFVFSSSVLGAGTGTPSWTTSEITIKGTQPISKTPIPAAALLLGSGILGLFGVNKTRKTRSRA